MWENKGQKTEDKFAIGTFRSAINKFVSDTYNFIYPVA